MVTPIHHLPASGFSTVHCSEALPRNHERQSKALELGATDEGECFFSPTDAEPAAEAFARLLERKGLTDRRGEIDRNQTPV